MSSYPDSDLFDENPLDILSETLEDEIKDDLDEVSLLEATVPQRRMVLPVSEDAGESKDSGGTPSIGSPSNSPLPPWGTESSPVGQVSSPPPLRREGSTPTTPFAPTQDDLDQYTYKEVIVDKNGLPRHAGSDTQEGLFVRGFKKAAEQSLFLFCKAVLNRHFLTDSLHRPVCEFLQKVPPFRKLVLMPREHAKTAIVSGGLPLHIIIQPAETNIYFPGMEGSECRIMLAGENMRMAKKNLRVLEEVHSGNKLFRALWPERVWEAPRRESKLWNQEALIFPRQNEWPDPTIWAIGVDGAVTGSRPNVMIKDDLVSVEAANSDVVMDTAIDWHKASRALLDRYEVSTGLQSLEFIIGCLTADSLVTMEDGRPKPINEVKKGEYVWQATEGGYVQRAKVERVIPQGVAETWTISTTTHDIRATGNHPFLISTRRCDLSWKRADQLREGDLIVAHKSLMSWTNFGRFDNFEAEFCWLFGFMLGDGWANNRARRGYVCFSPGIDEEQNQRVLNALKRYTPCNKWYLTKGRYYRTDSVEGADFWEELGFKGSAKTKRVPDWVCFLDNEQQINFLRGFCDADGGWQNHQTWRVEISNRGLLEDLRHIACLCGVRTGRLLTRERVVQAPNSPYPTRSICHSASFNFASVDRHETVNKNPYGGLNVGRDTKLAEELRFERVIGVKRNRIAEEVWDLTVEGNHSFFANGLAVHNTRWAVFDLYSYIIDNDMSVEVISEEFHQIIRDGKILWPEKHTEESIAQLRSEHGSMFYLLYLNSAADPNLTDFDLDLVREFKIIDDHIVFEEDARDARLVELFNKKSDSPAPPSVPSGTRLTPDLMRDMFARREYFRARRD